MSVAFQVAAKSFLPSRFGFVLFTKSLSFLCELLLVDACRNLTARENSLYQFFMPRYLAANGGFGF